MGYYGWEEECDIAVECDECKVYESTIENLKEEAATTEKLVTSIVKILYSQEKIDFTNLEKEIDNLCYHLDIPMIEGDLQIQQKRLPSFLSNILELNQIAQ